MRHGRTVLVLGGGIGGVVAATRLRELLPSEDRVVLVDREPHHVFQPSFLWLLVGKRRARQIQRPLSRLRDKGIDVVTGEITEIRPDAKRIRVNGTDVSADAMVIALGAGLAPHLIPGLAEAGHNLYSLSGASRAYDALRGFHSGRVVVLTAAPAYKCPAAPYEAAMLVRDFLTRQEAEVHLFAAEPGPMGTAGPEVSAAVQAMVEARGVSYHPSHQVDHVHVSRRQLKFADGSSAPFDLLLYVPPHEAPQIVRRAPFASDGWIAVDRESLATEFPMVYAIGDVTSIPLPSGSVLPKAGVFAHTQAEIVAKTLAAELTGGTPGERFDGHGACFIETGGGRAGYGSGNFYAEPAPRMRLHKPSRWWHLGKVLFEKRWLWKWF